MIYEDWKYAQIGIGVSRCPTDIDQDKTLLDEAADERRRNPQYVVVPGKLGQPFSAQLKRSGEITAPIDAPRLWTARDRFRIR